MDDPLFQETVRHLLFLEHLTRDVMCMEDTGEVVNGNWKSEAGAAIPFQGTCDYLLARLRTALQHAMIPVS